MAFSSSSSHKYLFTVISVVICLILSLFIVGCVSFLNIENTLKSTYWVKVSAFSSGYLDDETQLSPKNVTLFTGGSNLNAVNNTSNSSSLLYHNYRYYYYGLQGVYLTGHTYTYELGRVTSYSENLCSLLNNNCGDCELPGIVAFALCLIAAVSSFILLPVTITRAVSDSLCSKILGCMLCLICLASSIGAFVTFKLNCYTSIYNNIYSADFNTIKNDGVAIAYGPGFIVIVTNFALLVFVALAYILMPVTVRSSAVTVNGTKIQNDPRRSETDADSIEVGAGNTSESSDFR